MHKGCFYFAVSNNSLYSKSIEVIQEELVEHLGETVCVPLNTDMYSTLTFNIPTSNEKRAEGVSNVKNIYLCFDKGNSTLVYINGKDLGVGFKVKDKIYGYGNLETLVFMVEYIRVWN